MRGAHNIRRQGRATIVGALLATFAICAAAAPDAEPAWNYRVQPGDNLFDLSAAYLKERTSWRELQKLNHVPDPLRLQPGSTVKMPIRLLRREASVAQAVFVQGQVELRRAGSAATALHTGEELHSGDALSTGEQATLTLRFVDGSRLLVAPRSEVSLDELLVFGRSAVPAMRLQLQKGSADSKVQPSAERPPDYQLRTPTLSLGVRGTEFRVQVSEDGRSARAEVLEGRVAGTPAGAATQPIPAGYGLAAVQGQKPSALTKLLPAPSLAGVPTRLERIPLAIAWPPLDGAVAYRAQLFDGDEHLLLDGRFATPGAQWADLPDGSYRLRLRGIDAIGLEGLAAELPLVLKARPEPPFARAPAPQARVYGDSATFAWTQPASATSFRLEVTGADGAPVFARSGITGAEQSVPLSPGHYRWRVASTATQADGKPDDGPWGDPQAFEQRPVPPSPPLEPPAIDGDQLRFSWAAVPGAARYELQWAADPDFKQLIAEPKTDAPTLLLPHPGPGRYWLRVRSVDELGYAGPWGTAQLVTLPRPWWPWLLLLVPFAF